MNEDEARVNRLLQRLQKLPSPQQSSNLSLITSSLAQLQSQWQSSRASNHSQLTHLSSHLQSLQKQFSTSSLQHQRRQQQLLDCLATTQQTCNQLITQYTRQQSQNHSKFEQKAAQLLKAHKVEMRDIANTDKEVGEELRKYGEMMPEMRERVRGSKNERGEIEEKIYLQFADRLTKLKREFDEECRAREKEHTALIQILNGIKEKSLEAIKRQRAEREASQTLLLKVIQQTIDRITQLD